MEEILNKLNGLEKLLKEQCLLQKDVLNCNEAAQYLGFKKSYLYKLTSDGQIPHYKPQGKSLFFKRVELDQWLTRNRVASKQELETKAANYVLKGKTAK